MIRYKEVDVPLFPLTITMYSGESDEVNTHFQKTYKLNLEIPDTYIGCWSQFGCGCGVIWVKDHKDIPTLVHEITHAVRASLEHLGITHTADSCETFAYYSEWLVEQWLDNKKWKKINKGK